MLKKLNKYIICGLQFGILIWRVVLVLHQAAVEIGIPHDFVKKKIKKKYFIGGHQHFNEGLHVILLLVFSDEKSLLFLSIK